MVKVYYALPNGYLSLDLGDIPISKYIYTVFDWKLPLC